MQRLAGMAAELTGEQKEGGVFDSKWKTERPKTASLLETQSIENQQVIIQLLLAERWGFAEFQDDVIVVTFPFQFLREDAHLGWGGAADAAPGLGVDLIGPGEV